MTETFKIDRLSWQGDGVGRVYGTAIAVTIHVARTVFTCLLSFGPTVR